MGQIATKAFCNTLKSGSFSGDTTQCPTKSEIESAGFTIIGGSYESNQLVQEEHLANQWWEYTFSVDPSSTSIPNTGGSSNFTITSYKTLYQTSSSGTKVQISQSSVDYSATNSGPGNVSKGEVSSSSPFQATCTVSLDANSSSSIREGTINFTQAEDSGETVVVTYTQSVGEMTYGDIIITAEEGASTVIAPAGNCTISGSADQTTGAMTNYRISYSQTWGWNGSTTGGGVITSGGVISWTSHPYDSLGTTITSQEDTGDDLTATVTLNGKTETYNFNIYRQENTRTAESTVWDEEADIEWNDFSISIGGNNPISRDGGSVTLSPTTNSGTQGGTIPYTYTSGSTSEERTSRSVSENISYAITSPVSGFSISGNTVTATSNDGDTRSVIVKGTGSRSGEGNSKEVTISQEEGKYTYTLTVSRSTISFNSSGSSSNNTFTVISYKTRGGVNTALPWKSSGTSSPIKITNGSGNGGTNAQTVTVSADSRETNTSSINQTLTITQNESNNTKTVTISQAGAKSSGYTFITSPTSLSFTSGGGQKSFTVRSYQSFDTGSTKSISWSNGRISSGGSFFSTNKTSGSDNTSVTITAKANDSVETRPGTFAATQSSSNKTVNVPLSLDGETPTGTLIARWIPSGIPVGQSVTVDITIKRGGDGLTYHLMYTGNEQEETTYTLRTGTWTVDRSMSYGNFSGIDSFTINLNQTTYANINVGYV